MTPIEDITKQWRQAALDGDVEAYMDFVGDDVVFLGPGLEPIVGKESAWRFVAGALAPFVTETLDNRETVTSGGLGFVWGTYEATFLAKKNDTESREFGKHVFLWQRQEGGEWKLKLAIWNTM
jgi:ketosteroid isomerase-like protein